MQRFMMHSRMVNILVYSILVISLVVVCGVGYKFVNRYYKEAFLIRLDPLGLANRLDVSRDTTKRLVVGLGDSRMHAWDFQLTNNEYQYVNAGINSQTTEQIRLRFEREVLPLKPDILIIQAGINDLKLVSLFPSNHRAIIDRCKENIGTIVSQAKASGTRVILTTVFPVAKPSIMRRAIYDESIREAVKEVNAFMKTIADNRTVFLIDAFQLLVDDEGFVQAAYAEDFLHINLAGYNVLNSAIYTMLP